MNIRSYIAVRHKILIRSNKNLKLQLAITTCIYYIYVIQFIQLLLGIATYIATGHYKIK